jgi:DNA primase
MPVIPPHLIDEVRLASDIVDVVSDHVALKKKGRNFFGLCPFHNEKTPSFSVNPDKQIFHCFGCGAGGNVFTFVQKQDGVGFPEAVRVLAKRARIPIPEPESEDLAVTQHKEALYYANQFAAAFFHEMLFSTAGAAALTYAQQRGFDEKTLREFGAGYAPAAWDALLDHANKHQLKPETLVEAGLLNARDDGGFYDRFRNRLMFPIHNQSGRVVAFGGRRLPPERDDTPKYLNTAETPIYHKGRLLYALHMARDSAKEKSFLIVVEGYADAMRMHAAGLTNTVATAGTALTEEQARLMLRLVKSVTLLYDSDTAGAAATLRGADILVENGLHVMVAALAAGEDPDSYVLKYGAPAMQKVIAEAIPLLDFKMQNTALNAGSVANPAQRAEALASLAETVAKMASDDQRSRIVQQLAKRLQLREEVLWAEINRVRTVRRPVAGRGKNEVQGFALRTAGQIFAERCRETESELVRIMIIYPEAIAFVFSFMHIEDFHDGEMREMAMVLAGLVDKGATFEREDLLHHFIQPQQAEFVSRVIHHDALREGVAEDYRRWAADCMAKLQRLMVQEHMRELQELIRARESSGGDTTELAQQFHEYLDQLRRIRAENFLLVNEEESA